MRLFITLLLLCYDVSAMSLADKQCMANVVFYEANSEPLVGQRAVYDVVLNRARVSKKSICEVISQPYQFSWYGLKPIKKFDKNMQLLLTNVKKKPSILDERFQYFYSGKKPKWANGMECFKLEDHYLCKIVNYKGENRGS